MPTKRTVLEYRTLNLEIVAEFDSPQTVEMVCEQLSQVCSVKRLERSSKSEYNESDARAIMCVVCEDADRGSRDCERTPPPPENCTTCLRSIDNVCVLYTNFNNCLVVRKYSHNGKYCVNVAAVQVYWLRTRTATRV
ncbi:hypothetical protein LSAT2_032432 [Lamellibrachia satsuma]|nr:hypothetical protein LSAT2_032432 [Lamellibrachia satsuma]